MFERLSQLAWAQFWQVSLLIVVVGVLTHYLSRRWPHFAWTLWVIVIVKCVTPPIWYSPSGFFCWQATKPILPHVEYTLPEDVFGKSSSNAPAGAFEQSPSMIATNSKLASGAVPIAGQSFNTPDYLGHVSNQTIAFLSSQRFANILLGIWAFGAGLISALLLYRWWSVFKHIATTRSRVSQHLTDEVNMLCNQLGIRRKFKVVVTRANYGPCVFGFFKPTLILPDSVVRGTDQKVMRSILAHEIIHVRRGDTLLDFLQMFAQVLWWFHPMVWWANRQVNRLSEHCCDDETVVGLSCQPISYARGLLRVLELRNEIQPIVAVSGMRAAEVTRRRLESLMSRKSSLLARAPALCWLLALGGGLFFLPGSFDNISPFGGNPDQKKVTVSPESKAQSAFAREDWEAAAESYHEVVANHPKNGLAWFRLGYALHSQGKYQQAIVAHQQAATFPSAKHIATYNWACALCCLGRHEEALNKLADSIEYGFQSYRILKEDKDWIALKDNPRFQAMLEQLGNHTKDVYRQFDFYIGQWEVVRANGRKIGNNVVTIDSKGYLITEKWTGVDGSTGTSINFYDPNEEVWKQTWVNGSGRVVRLNGVFEDGAMLFEGCSTEKDGTEQLVKMKIEPVLAGQVKQTVHKSADKGKTWNKKYEVFYKKID